MMFFFPIAHGALGIFDELLLILAVGAFLIMLAAPMAAALFRHGDLGPEADTPAEALPEPVDSDPTHFRLE